MQKIVGWSPTRDVFCVSRWCVDGVMANGKGIGSDSYDGKSPCSVMVNISVCDAEDCRFKSYLRTLDRCLSGLRFQSWKLMYFNTVGSNPTLSEKWKEIWQFFKLFQKKLGGEFFILWSLFVAALFSIFGRFLLGSFLFVYLLHN